MAMSSENEEVELLTVHEVDEFLSIWGEFEGSPSDPAEAGWTSLPLVTGREGEGIDGIPCSNKSKMKSSGDAEEKKEEKGSYADEKIEKSRPSRRTKRIF